MHKAAGDRHGLKVLVLGAGGMLGHAVLRFFAMDPGVCVVGSVRSSQTLRLLPPELQQSLVASVDVESLDSVIRLFALVRPAVVINCVGLVKQLQGAGDPGAAIPINALLPHRLALLCQVAGARLIHISTDCVFSGSKGMYGEDEVADATDLYGRSKYLGEVDYPNAVTLRTSIIGPELDSAHGLVGWFLGQKGEVRGFTRAIFSGLPTVELARVIKDFVIPHAQLRGVFHVGADPISKYDLLRLVARAYGKPEELIPDDTLRIDRSLDSSRFRKLTGYQPRAWPELVDDMRRFG